MSGGYEEAARQLLAFDIDIGALHHWVNDTDERLDGPFFCPRLLLLNHVLFKVHLFEYGLRYTCAKISSNLSYPYGSCKQLFAAFLSFVFYATLE
ncbi:hypothetical protein TNCV_384531 [Trichonephila clavipes]|nr:hypothetical protein TNCV_384531 [Trichonephila clavipes]